MFYYDKFVLFGCLFKYYILQHQSTFDRNEINIYRVTINNKKYNDKYLYIIGEKKYYCYL